MNSFLFVVMFKLKQEWRSISDWLSALQFLLASVFIVYLIFDSLNSKMWLSLYWVIAVFSLIHASSRGLKEELEEEYQMLYQLLSAESVLLSGLLIGFIQNLFLLSILWGAMYFLFGNFVINSLSFVVSLILAAFNFSAITHLMNGIAIRSNKSQSLYPVLTIPLIIPIILELYNIGAISVGINPVANNWASDAFILSGLGLCFSVASVFLFPYIWSD
ncbi:hypothetical protein [Membranihabitans marinus]|uniref:hypothetical protein n=1 Tax=Membranihabitans marinus TaxID=1227546 RepID=UPI001F252F7D|nr:hypothetical protein [Membranihabitans marinus]